MPAPMAAQPTAAASSSAVSSRHSSPEILATRNLVSLRTHTDHAFYYRPTRREAPDLLRKATAHSGWGARADNRYAAQRVIRERAGIVWVAVRPGG